MKILILNHYAGSTTLGMEFRPYFLARIWVELGHEVTIVASSFSHVRMRQPEVDGYISGQEIDGINYIWLHGSEYSGSGVKRAINIFQYVFLSIFALPRRISIDFDILIASSTYPLDIFPALLFRKLRKRTFLVFEPHDLWPMALTELGGMSPWHPFVLLNSLAEKVACKYSDSIISMHPGNIDHLESRGAKRENFYHIPNGVNIDDWVAGKEGQSSLSARIQLLKKSGKKLVMYVGSISIANDLDLLIEAVEQSNCNAEYVIIGDGPERHRLEAGARDRSLPIHFFGHIEKGEIPNILSLADVCYVGFMFNPLYRYGTSANKLWDYMMASKPIVMSIDSCNDPVAEANCGITVNSGTSKDLATALDKILLLSDSDRETLGRNGREYVIKNNSYDVLAKKMLVIFENGLDGMNAKKD